MSKKIVKRTEYNKKIAKSVDESLIRKNQDINQSIKHIKKAIWFDILKLQEKEETTIESKRKMESSIDYMTSHKLEVEYPYMSHFNIQESIFSADSSINASIKDADSSNHKLNNPKVIKNDLQSRELHIKNVSSYASTFLEDKTKEQAQNNSQYRDALSYSDQRDIFSSKYSHYSLEDDRSQLHSGTSMIHVDNVKDKKIIDRQIKHLHQEPYEKLLCLSQIASEAGRLPYEKSRECAISSPFEPKKKMQITHVPSNQYIDSEKRDSKLLSLNEKSVKIDRKPTHFEKNQRIEIENNLYSEKNTFSRFHTSKREKNLFENELKIYSAYNIADDEKYTHNSIKTEGLSNPKVSTLFSPINLRTINENFSDVISSQPQNRDSFNIKEINIMKYLSNSLIDNNIKYVKKMYSPNFHFSTDSKRAFSGLKDCNATSIPIRCQNQGYLDFNEQEYSYNPDSATVLGFSGQPELENRFHQNDSEVLKSPEAKDYTKSYPIFTKNELLNSKVGKIIDGEISPTIRDKRNIQQANYKECDTKSIDFATNLNRAHGKRMRFHSNYADKTAFNANYDLNSDIQEPNNSKMPCIRLGKENTGESYTLEPPKKVENEYISEKAKNTPLSHHTPYQNYRYSSIHEKYRTLDNPRNFNKSTETYKYKKYRFQTTHNHVFNRPVNHNSSLSSTFSTINRVASGTFQSVYYFQLDLVSFFYHRNEPISVLISPVLDAIRTKKCPGILLIAERLLDFIKIDGFHDIWHRNRHVNNKVSQNRRTISMTRSEEGSPSIENKKNSSKDNDVRLSNNIQGPLSIKTENFVLKKEKKAHHQFLSNINVLIKYIDSDQYRRNQDKIFNKKPCFQTQKSTTAPIPFSLHVGNKSSYHIEQAPQKDSFEIDKRFPSTKKGVGESRYSLNTSINHPKKDITGKRRKHETSSDQLCESITTDKQSINLETTVEDTLQRILLKSSPHHRTLNLPTVLHSLYLAYQYLNPSNNINLNSFEGLLPELLEYKEFLESEIKKANQISQIAKLKERGYNPHDSKMKPNVYSNQKSSLDQKDLINMKNIIEKEECSKKEQIVNFESNKVQEEMQIEDQGVYLRYHVEKSPMSNFTLKKTKKSDNVTNFNWHELHNKNQSDEKPFIDRSGTNITEKPPLKQYDMRDFRFKCIIEEPQTKFLDMKSLPLINKENPNHGFSLSYYLINKYYLKQLLIILAKYYEKKSEQFFHILNRKEKVNQFNTHGERKMIDYYTKIHTNLLISCIALSPKTYEQPYILFQIALGNFYLKNYQISIRILSQLSQMIRNNLDALSDIYTLMAEVVYYSKIGSSECPLHKPAIYLRTILKLNPVYQPAQYKLVELTFHEIERIKCSDSESKNLEKIVRAFDFSFQKKLERLKFNEKEKQNSESQADKIFERIQSKKQSEDSISLKCKMDTIRKENSIHNIKCSSGQSKNLDIDESLNETIGKESPSLIDPRTQAISQKENSLIDEMFQISTKMLGNRDISTKNNIHRIQVIQKNRNLCHDHTLKTGKQIDPVAECTLPDHDETSHHFEHTGISSNISENRYSDHSHEDRPDEKDYSSSPKDLNNTCISLRKSDEHARMQNSDSCNDLISYNNLIKCIRKLPYSTYTLYYFLYCLYMNGEYHLIDLLIRRRTRDVKSQLTIEQWVHQQTTQRIKEREENTLKMQCLDNTEIHDRQPAFKFKDCSSDFYTHPLDPYFDTLQIITSGYRDKVNEMRRKAMKRPKVNNFYYWFKRGCY